MMKNYNIARLALLACRLENNTNAMMTAHLTLVPSCFNILIIPER